MTYRQCLSYGREKLLQNEVTDAGIDAWLLMEFVFGLSRSQYFLHSEEEAADDKTAKYKELIAKRATHYPLQYITNEAWFYGRAFYVDSRVLIPRQDTEVLIETVLEELKDGMHVLDMCTGSGCILLTLMLEKKVDGVGSDLSEDALAVAKENAKRLMVTDAVFRAGDLFEGFDEKESFDVIVSNPPYIETAEIDKLMKEVRDFEPVSALLGFEDGLYFYRKIAREARHFLKDGGRLCFEIGYNQGEALKEILCKEGYRDIAVIKDLSGNQRVAFARL